MRSMRDGAEDYLTLRRGLGFKLKRPARFLRSFVESDTPRRAGGLMSWAASKAVGPWV